MNKPLLHPRTNRLIELYLSKKPQAMLLSGAEGVGKTHLAEWIATQINIPTSLIAASEGQSTITIDQIRSLYGKTKSGTPQIIIIKEAHVMSMEAQNAFLKLLEEPPAHTHFILTSTSLNQLLSTILSRVHVIEVIEPTEAMFQEYFADNSTEFSQLVRTARRAPAIVAVAKKDSERRTELIDSMSQAKEFYAASSYERHIIFISNGYDRPWALSLLKNLSAIIAALIKVRTEDKKTLIRLNQQAQLIIQTTQILTAGRSNAKIHLTKLAEML